MLTTRFCCLIALFSLCLSACASSTSHWVELKGQRYAVEIADDVNERARGLMYRDALPADYGMLFIYDQQQPLAFWMKNTKIPLDILYFDAKRKLVSIQRDIPPCSLGDRCPAYPSARPALYALELNAGRAQAMDIQHGDVLSFSSNIPTTGTP